MKQFSPTVMQEYEDLVSQFPNKKSTLMMVLRLVEREFGCIDEDGMALAASLCDVSAAHVAGMVTFYTHFKRSVHGKHRIMVCSTLMCALGGSQQVEDRVFARLGIKAGERTADGLFSLEKVECLADCDKPTVVQVDREHYNKVNSESVDRILDELLKKENKTDADYKGKVGVKMDLGMPYTPVQAS